MKLKSDFHIAGQLMESHPEYSERDADMVIRMFEYDISIALEHTSKTGDIWEIEFPHSCVLYVRNHRHLPEYHTAIVKFADGLNILVR